MSIYYTLWYIMIYSILGWCAEVVFHTLCCGDFENRGFLNGPVCPIYGFGAALVITLLNPFVDNIPVLFVASAVITTVLEGLTGYVLEKLFHTKWWDYSDMPFNIGGYVCLKFSVLWGFACVIVMRTVQPLINAFIAMFGTTVGTLVLSCFYALFVCDAVVTVNAVIKLNKRLRAMEEVAENMRRLSDFMGEHIHEGVLNAADKSYTVKGKVDEYKTDITEKQLAAAIGIAGTKTSIENDMKKKRVKWEQEFAEQRKRLEELTEENGKVQKRLLRAFPCATSRRNNEMLERLKERLKRK